MKKILGWFFKNTPPRMDSMDFAVAFLRIFAGLMMIPYGWGKIERYDALRVGFFGDPVGLGHEPSLIICIFQQVFCSAMLVLGVQSRFAAFMLFTNMAVAVKFHFFDPFCAVKALPMLFLGIYAFLVVSGGGRYSLDALAFKNHPASGPSCGNVSTALRTALMGAAFFMSWILFGNLFGLGGWISAALLAVVFAMFLISIYGFCPFRWAMSKMLGR